MGELFSDIGRCSIFIAAVEYVLISSYCLYAFCKRRNDFVMNIGISTLSSGLSNIIYSCVISGVDWDSALPGLFDFFETLAKALETAGFAIYAYFVVIRMRYLVRFPLAVKSRILLKILVFVLALLNFVLYLLQKFVTSWSEDQLATIDNLEMPVQIVSLFIFLIINITVNFLLMKVMMRRYGVQEQIRFMYFSWILSITFILFFVIEEIVDWSGLNFGGQLTIAILGQSFLALHFAVEYVYQAMLQTIISNTKGTTGDLPMPT